MRTLASFSTVTVDGFYEAPDQEFDWPIIDDDFTALSIEELWGDATLPLRSSRQR